jgi:predicted negative regulator of RcsB-dependent stress response
MNNQSNKSFWAPLLEKNFVVLVLGVSVCVATLIGYVDYAQHARQDAANSAVQSSSVTNAVGEVVSPGINGGVAPTATVTQDSQPPIAAASVTKR